MASTGGELPLQLAYPLEPGNASRFAADFVQQAIAQGMPLDYSAGSVAALDAIIGSLRGEGVPPDRVADVLFGFGCYLGECVVRATSGRWSDAAEARLTRPGLFPIAVVLPDGRGCDPVSQPFVALTDGPPETLSAFFATYVTTS